MAREKRAKSNIYEDNWKKAILFCESTGLPYKIIRTNYTVTIESEFMNMKYAPDMSKGAFVSGAMIKRDIKNTGIEPPEITAKDVNYFDFAPQEVIQFCPNTFYNIDIKSAYANILFNHSLITERTKALMSRLPKKDRLAAIGMLASKKCHFNMLGSECISDYEEVSDMANWFFFCVNRTNEIMNKCREICGKSFLFFWVDGIFFTDISKIESVSNYLRSIGYNYSLDICTQPNYYENTGAKCFEYLKGDEKKQLFLPKKNSEIDEFLIKFLSL
jgi:hypothetical protein